jgi:hypothetical protein
VKYCRTIMLLRLITFKNYVTQLSNYTGTEGPYTKDQINTILSTDVWTSDEELE